MWAEAQTCLDSNKHELNLSGAALAARLEESDGTVPDELCDKLGPVLTRLELSKCPSLVSLPGSISSMCALIDLLVPNNGLTSLPGDSRSSNCSTAATAAATIGQLCCARILV